MIECSTDLWQLRSTRTRSSLPTNPCQTILFAADVIEERAQFRDRDREIGAQGILAEEVMESAAHRTFFEGDTAGMTRRVPGVVRARDMGHQRLEEGRQQPLEIGFGVALDLAGDKGDSVLEEIDHLADLAQKLAAAALLRFDRLAARGL
jgi:hypothetical protein